MTKPYIASLPRKTGPLAPEHLGLVRRRTLPFLDRAEHYSIGHLMAEAYLQGLRDAVSASEDA